MGEKDVVNRELYWYYPHYSPQAKQPAAAIRVGRYKLIQFYDPEKVELYELVDDLSEQNNLADKMPQKRDELLAKLEDWLKVNKTIMHTLNPNYKS